MYAACAGAYQPRSIDVKQPGNPFRCAAGKGDRVLELISNGRVSYLEVRSGKVS